VWLLSLKKKNHLTLTGNVWVDDFIVGVLICFLTLFVNQHFLVCYGKKVCSRNCLWVSRIKHFGSRVHVSSDSKVGFIVFSVTPQKPDRVENVDVPPPCARLSLPLRYTPRLPHHLQINSPSKQRKPCSHSILHTTHTHALIHTLSVFSFVCSISE